MVELAISAQIAIPLLVVSTYTAHKVKCYFVPSRFCVFNVLCVLLLLFCLLQSDSRSIQLNTFSTVSALESHLEVQNCCYLIFLIGSSCSVSNSFNVDFIFITTNSWVKCYLHNFEPSSKVWLRVKTIKCNFHWSAYDMKNIFCLFERPFKIQKNGVFLFEISFFCFSDIYWCFSIMQIRSVMTSYCWQLKMVKYWINDISGNIEALFLKLGTINVHHKRNTMTPLMPLPWQQFGH